MSDAFRSPIDVEHFRKLESTIESLLTNSKEMTYGDLLTESIRANRWGLSSDMVAVVFEQALALFRTQRTSAILFADRVLMPLIGNQTLADHSLKRLLECWADDRPAWFREPLYAAFHLAQANGAAVERFVLEDRWSVFETHAAYVFKATRSDVLFWRIVERLEDWGTTYDRKHYESRFKEILDVLVNNPPGASSLRAGLIRLLTRLESLRFCREHIQTVIAQTKDLRTLPHLLEACARDEQYERAFWRGHLEMADRGVARVRAHCESLLRCFGTDTANSIRDVHQHLTECEALPPRSERRRRRAVRPPVANTVFGLVNQYVKILA